MLVATRNPLNLGAAARAMSNFGFVDLRVVNPHEAAFREARSAVGAAALLARAEEYRSVAEAVADCALVVGTTSGYHRELQHPLRGLEEGAQLVRSNLSSGNVALMFGSEKRGLCNEDLSYCHWLLRIPTREEHISMNLGQAVAVCLYELVRDSGGGQPPPAGSRRQRAALPTRRCWSESPRCCSRRSARAATCMRRPRTSTPSRKKARLVGARLWRRKKCAAWCAASVYPRTMPRFGSACCGK